VRATETSDLSLVQDGTALTALPRGSLDFGNARRVHDRIAAALSPRPSQVVLDLSQLRYLDSSGAALVIALRQRLEREGIPFHVRGAAPHVQAFLSLVDQESVQKRALPAPLPTPGPITRLGAGALKLLEDCRELTAFTGSLVLGLRDALLRPRQLRWRELWLYMERTGVDALPIVSLISFLVGMIMAFQAAVQMAQFGADIYVANLVALVIVRELGPLVTAIIAAGRSGAAFAAEIGTMKVSEEIDALQVMGLDEVRFLVIPKVLGLLVMLPCLTLFADAVGITGGLVVAMGWLNLPAAVYLRQTRISLVPWDIYSGLVKSVAFAVLVAAVGCLRGFQAEGGAESVGQVTTSAVVSGIFLIIVADAVFTVLFHYW